MINKQNRSKVFLVIIAILLIANIAMLVFFLQKKKPETQNRRPDMKAYMTNFLQKEIGFNQQQLLQYDSLSKLQQAKMRSMFENVRNKKTEQFQQLSAANFSDSAINQVAEQSAAGQKIIQVETFTHIKKVRQLCTPEQLPKFDSLFVKIFNRKGMQGKKSQNKK